MLNLYNGTLMSSNRKLQYLLETKLSTDDKVPKTGRILRNKIFVIGFPPNCTEIDLETFFSNFGLVRETRIVKDENGITKGYAFITFVKERSVVHALEYRGPLYFMDRKLSINPAIKKQHPFLQPRRCLSSSTSIDTPSDMSSSSHHPKEHSSSTHSTFLPMMPMPMGPQSNGTTIQHYYHAAAQPFYHFNVPSQPVWQQYYSTITSYPSYTYLPAMPNSHGGHPMMSQIDSSVYYNSMIRFTHLPPNSKPFP